MSGWHLGIDFGTSFTVAAVLEDHQVKVLDIESNGQARIPSVAFLTADGDLLVGTNAQHQAVFAPERFEPSPKRCIADGEVFLGDDFVPVADLIAAVLRKVYTEACRQHGEVVPAATRVTHPAEWADARLNVIRAAIEAAGLPNPVLVPEPVAAAAWIAMAKTPPGGHIAVYDFGGGTFDAAVLRRTEAGFEVAGPPSGRDPLGGEDLDRQVIEHLGRLLVDEYPEQWAALMNPPDASSRRSAAGLRAEVQRAKETLSDVLACQLWIPGIEKEMQLTRAELEGMIGPQIDETLTALVEAIEAAGTTPSDLNGIYLVGGSSRIPLVADTIWRQLKIRPTVQDNPKSVVAMGAAAWGSPLQTEGASTPPDGRSDASSGRAPTLSIGTEENRFRSHVVLVKGAGAEERGSVFNGLLMIEQPTVPTVRIRDEPAHGRDIMSLSQEILQVRASRMAQFRELSVEPVDVLGISGGLERRFSAEGGTGTIAMFERYLVVGDRVLVLAAPELARAVADTVTLTPQMLPEGRYFEPHFTFPVPEGATISERLTLVHGKTGHQVIADHVRAPSAVTQEQWRERQTGALLRQVSGATVASVRPARVLNRLDGEEVVIRSAQGRAALLTKLWLAMLDDRNAYEVTITLREREEPLFTTLGAIAMLNPSVVPHRVTAS